MYLPFLLRLYPTIKVIATKLSFELGRISLQTFQAKIVDFDATSETLDFFDESERL